MKLAVRLVFIPFLVPSLCHKHTITTQRLHFFGKTSDKYDLKPYFFGSMLVQLRIDPLEAMSDGDGITRQDQRNLRASKGKGKGKGRGRGKKKAQPVEDSLPSADEASSGQPEGVVNEGDSKEPASSSEQLTSQSLGKESQRRKLWVSLPLGQHLRPQSQRQRDGQRQRRRGSLSQRRKGGLRQRQRQRQVQVGRKERAWVMVRSRTPSPSAKLANLRVMPPSRLLWRSGMSSRSFLLGVYSLFLLHVLLKYS